MSWNISTRLNNLQQQINNIANKGLTNPLEQVLNANNYSLTNLNILDSGSNVLELQSSNVGGITTNCDFSADGNITCKTLNYEDLNPPINPNGIIFNLLGDNISETSAGNFTLTNYNPYNGIITKQNVLNPSVSLTLNFSNIDGNNSFSFGFSSSNTLYPTGGFNSIEYGIYYYPIEDKITQITNGELTSNTYSYSNPQQIQVILRLIEGNLKVYINNTEITILEQPLGEGLYYFVACGYMSGTTTTTLSNVIVSQTINETLNQVLLNGNNANNQDIIGINSLTCETLNYTTLNPPIAQGGENLEETLTNGNSAGGLDITNIGTISGESINMTNNIFCNGYLQVGDLVSNTSQLHLLYGNGTTLGENYQVVGSAGGNFQIQLYKNNALYNQPLMIDDVNNILLKTNNLTYTQDGNTSYYINDTFYNPPMFKQIFSNTSGSFANFVLSPKIFFSTNVYTKSNPNNIYYGVNYGEILFTSLNLSFGLDTSVSPSPVFPSGCNATIFLSSTGTGAYDATLANSLIIPMSSGSINTTFNSSIPILLFCNSDSQFDKLYVMIYFDVIPPVGVTGYNCDMTNSNLVVSGYITNNQNSTLTFGS